MARKIRFPLHMSDGADVRTIEELQEHFDLESVLGYFTDGKLKTWLEDRYYDEQAAAVGELSTDMPDLGARLSAIFGIEAKDTDVDIEEIQRRKEKLRILSAYTADSEILDNVDFVAMDQDELFDILDMSPEKVYLFGGEFSIPFGKKNITYIGLNEAQVMLESKNSFSDYQKENICFVNLGADEYSIAEQYITDREYDKAFPLMQQAAEQGHPDAQFNLGAMYANGYGVQKDFSKAAKWFEKAAEQGHRGAQYSLGVMYDNGYGVQKDFSKAAKWFKKAAEQGDRKAQEKLNQLAFYL